MIRRLIFCASLLPLCAPLCISLPASAQQSSPAMPPAPGINKMDGMDNMEMGQHTPSTQPPAKTTPDQQSTASSTAPSLLLAVQGRPPLTLDAFLSIAQRSNPTLGESEAQVRAARAEANPGRALPQSPPSATVAITYAAAPTAAANKAATSSRRLCWEASWACSATSTHRKQTHCSSEPMPRSRAYGAAYKVLSTLHWQRKSW